MLRIIYNIYSFVIADELIFIQPERRIQKILIGGGKRKDRTCELCWSCSTGRQLNSWIIWIIIIVIFITIWIIWIISTVSHRYAMRPGDRQFDHDHVEVRAWAMSTSCFLYQKFCPAFPPQGPVVRRPISPNPGNLVPRAFPSKNGWGGFNG